MFGLALNLYHYLKLKSERKVTFVLLGLDNAGKTTLSNTLRGELAEEVSPSFGFNKSTLSEGKYTIDVFDLGGGKNIRKIWKTYLAEVHGVVFVVDAADAARFPEACEVLAELAADAAFQGKPLLVLANKQDLPVSASPAEVAQALGLPSLHHNSYNILPCSARAPPPAVPGGAQQADGRVRQGLKWLLGQVDSVYSTLDGRVKVEADAAREEALRRKKERDEAAKRAREERMRLREQEAAEQQQQQQQQQPQQEQEQSGPPLIGMPAVAEANNTGVVETNNVLSTIGPLTAELPNSIQTPKPLASGLPHPSGLPPTHDAAHAADAHVVEFSDLRPRADQRMTGDAAAPSRRHGVPPVVLPPTSSRPNSVSLAFASPQAQRQQHMGTEGGPTGSQQAFAEGREDGPPVRNGAALPLTSPPAMTDDSSSAVRLSRQGSPLSAGSSNGNRIAPVLTSEGAGTRH